MFIQDITSRKTADEQLRLLFDGTPDMIGIVGRDGHFRKVNPAMCSQLQYSEKEFLDMPLDLLVHPDDLKASREPTRAFLTSGDQLMYLENRFVAKVGSRSGFHGL